MANHIMTKKEVSDMMDDIAKFLTIAFVIHILMFAVEDNGDLLSEFALKIFLYIAIALFIYHLIVKKITNKLFIKK